LRKDVNLKEPTTELFIELTEREILFFLKDNLKREAEQQAVLTQSLDKRKVEGKHQAPFPGHSIRKTVPGRD